MGYIYFSSRDSSNGIFSRFKKEVGTYDVLCLGDSFTFGESVEVEDTYPARLQKILNDNYPEQSFRVINAGVCERNSSQVLQNLPKKIRYYQPDLIILLVGASNRFNFIGFDKEKTIYSKLKDAVYGLRVYKMLKIIALNLKFRILIWNLKQNDDPEACELLSGRTLRNAINPNRDIWEEAADVKHDLIHYLDKIGKTEEASKLFRKSLEVDPNSDLFEHQIYEFCDDIYNENISYEYNQLLMDFQKELKNNPDLKDDRLFMNIILFFQNLQKADNEEKNDQRLREDLKKIVDICLENNIKIVIQDYPSPYLNLIADRALKDIAVEHSISLVENGKIFGKLVKEGKKEDYLKGDGHCTPLGYRVMAENVYEVILSENIFSK